MRTKLIVTIEIEEQFEETEKLWNNLREKGELKVKELFDSEQIIYVCELGSLNAASGRMTLTNAIKGNSSLPEPKQTNIKCIMATRGT